jgi:hypothetical protein
MSVANAGFLKWKQSTIQSDVWLILHITVYLYAKNYFLLANLNTHLIHVPVSVRNGEIFWLTLIDTSTDEDELLKKLRNIASLRTTGEYTSAKKGDACTPILGPWASGFRRPTTYLSGCRRI